MQTLAAILNQPNITISAAFYGTVSILKDPDIFELDSEALVVELERAVNAPLDPIVRAKVLAGFTVYTTDLIYKDLPAFIEFCNLASDTSPSAPDVFDPADAYEIAWGRIEIAIIDPEQDEKLIEDDRNPFVRRSQQMQTTKMRFSPEILRYCGVALQREGAIRPIFSLPDALMTPPSDEGDPVLLQTALERHHEIERSIADYVYRNAEEMLEQLSMIPTADKQPLVTKEMREGILSALKLPES